MARDRLRYALTRGWARRSRSRRCSRRSRSCLWRGAGALRPATRSADGQWRGVSRGINYFGGLTVTNCSGFGRTCSRGLPIVVARRSHAPRAIAKRITRSLSTANLALESKIEAQSLLAAIVASSDDRSSARTLEAYHVVEPGRRAVFGWQRARAIGQSIQLIVPPELRDQELEISSELRAAERSRTPRCRAACARTATRCTCRYDLAGVRPARLTSSGVEDGARHHARKHGRRLLRSEERSGCWSAFTTRRAPRRSGLVMRESRHACRPAFRRGRACAYGEVDVAQHQIDDHARLPEDLPTVAGRYPLGRVRPLMIGELKAGRTATSRRSAPIR
jgi:hypothetical protein